MFNYFSKDLKETPIKDIEAEDLNTFFNESLMKRRINIPWANCLQNQVKHITWRKFMQRLFLGKMM